MKKRILIATSIMAILLGATGCTKTVTTSYTDEDGNTTTTTTTTDNSGTTTITENTDAEGNVVSHEQDGFITATLRFENLCGTDIYELYISSNSSNEWGENIISEGNAPLADGEAITWNDAFTYSEDYLMWDIRAVDVNGEAISFEGLDVSKAEDKNNITFTLEYSDEKGYTASVIGPVNQVQDNPPQEDQEEETDTDEQTYMVIESEDGYSITYNPELFENEEGGEYEGYNSVYLRCIIDEENMYENFVDVGLVADYTAKDLIDGIAHQNDTEASECKLSLVNGEYDAYYCEYNVTDTFVVTTYVIETQEGAYKIEIGSHIYDDDDEYAYQVSGAIDEVLLDMTFEV